MSEDILRMEREMEGMVERSEMVSAVALDRREQGAITLRFLMNDVAWDVHARQVRLPKDLAEQLLNMLMDELEEPVPRLRQRYA